MEKNLHGGGSSLREGDGVKTGWLQGVGGGGEAAECSISKRDLVLSRGQLPSSHPKPAYLPRSPALVSTAVL